MYFVGVLTQGMVISDMKFANISSIYKCT